MVITGYRIAALADIAYIYLDLSPIYSTLVLSGSYFQDPDAKSTTILALSTMHACFYPLN